MVRELSLASDPVILHIWSCLHNYAYSDALFAAERLYAETHNSESLYMLATSLYKIGRPRQVNKLLNSAKSLPPKSRYLLARCYFDIGSLTEAEEALLLTGLSSTSLDEIIKVYEEQSCYVLLLLGDICRRQGRISDAIAYYKKCLEVNPLMWSAFKNLCNIGEYVDPSSTFQCPDELCLNTPAYAVVLDNLHSTHCVNDKAARENVNPQLASNQSSLSCADFEENSQELYHDANQLCDFQRNFVSFCSKSYVEDLAPSTKSVDLHTPDEFVPLALSPKAPKAVTVRSPVIRSLYGNEASRFGLLSFFPQSPMFACVPIFSKLSGNQTASQESFLSSSVRIAPSQCLPVWQLALSQIDDGQNDTGCLRIPSQRNRTSSDNSGTIDVRKDQQITEFEGNQNPTDTAKMLSSSANTSVKFTTPVVTGRQSIATPTSALRNLVSTTASKQGIFNHESNSYSTNISLVNTPNARIEPPLLRSAVQRNVCPSPSIHHNRDSPLVLRSNLQFFNPACQSPGLLTSSSTPRPLSSQQTSTGCRTVENTTASAEVITGGPRTRSQVAAAAAVARASGIQRRSNRFLKSRGHNRKLDPKLLPPESAENSVSTQAKVNSPNICSTRSPPKTLHSAIEDPPVFGCSNYYRVPLSVETAASAKDDPRTQSLQQYLNLLSQLGKAYQMLVQHQWRSATRLLLKLPSSQLQTGRVLAWAARAYMDNADYQTAHKLFSEARRLEPWQLCGMDFYSTVLWQIQADQELSQLAHDLLELDRNAPEPWCAAGNCFSLQGEHETAIKFFRRALQVSPTNVYSWTLLGHEQSTLEEFDRALAAFQFALRIDPRHYNALFGISNVYYKQEKFELAETYLIRAVALFPQSHLLLANLAALRSRLGRLDDGYGSAMDLISRACKIQPNNPLARYHKASILYHLGRYSEVLSELQKLLVLTPREAMVYLMIGHTYKKLGNTPQAMIHYSWAMELDPKGANTHLRDIMTNPPITNRTSNRQGTSEPGICGGVTGSVSGSSVGVGSVGGSQSTVNNSARAHLGAFQAGIRGNFAAEEQEQGEEEEEEEDESEVIDRTSGTDEETMNNSLLHHPSSQSGGGGGTRSNHLVRRLTDFSLLYESGAGSFGVGSYEQDSVMSDPDEEHYDTMDIGGNGVDNSNNRTEHSISDD